MKNSTRGLIASGLMLTGSMAAAGCKADVQPVNDPFLRSVDAMTDKYNLSAKGILGLIGCESTFNQFANKGKSSPYKGYLQQGQQYWAGRYADYMRRNPYQPVPNDIYDTNANLMISGNMMPNLKVLRQNWECESKYQCYTKPEGPQCASEAWKAKLNAAGAVAIGDRIVVIKPAEELQEQITDYMQVAQAADAFMQQYAPDLAIAA